MRRTVVTVALLTIVLGLAAPALAQRDPFEPPIDSGSSASEAEQPATQIQPQPDPAARPERLASTGADTGPWLALAYALVALGVGALAIARISRLPAR